MGIIYRISKVSEAAAYSDGNPGKGRFMACDHKIVKIDRLGVRGMVMRVSLTCPKTQEQQRPPIEFPSPSPTSTDPEIMDKVGMGAGALICQTCIFYRKTPEEVARLQRKLAGERLEAAEAAAKEAVLTREVQANEFGRALDMAEAINVRLAAGVITPEDATLLRHEFLRDTSGGPQALPPA